MAAGPIIDGYTDLIRIGRGGLGDVYRATRTASGAEVAIKVLRDVSDASVAWHRTRRELVALRALSGHANVVQIVDLLELETGPALVMELVPGGSVADLLHDRGGTLTAHEAVFVGRQVAAALVSAHARGIVHRDIKPQNLLIDAAGQVKLCDFGIAALTRDEQYRSRTNAVSMNYASPEDLEHDQEVGPAADVYSLAATLLHIVHGAPPTLKDRLAPWEPPGSADAHTAALDRVIARCLHPHPTIRPTAQAVLDALDGLALGAGDERVTALPAAVRRGAGSGSDTTLQPDPLAQGAPGEAAPPASLDEAGQAPASGRRRPGDPALAGLLGEATPGTGRAVADPPRPDPVESRRAPIAAGLAAAALVVVAVLVLWSRDAEAPVTSFVSVLPPASSTPAPTASVGGIPFVTLPRPDPLPPLDVPDWDVGGVGDCLVQVGVEASLTVVDCSEPHDLQRIGSGSVNDLERVAALDAYDRDVIEPAVTSACASAFSAFVGGGLGISQLGLVQRQPSAETWNDGDRDYSCYVGVAGYRIAGDARRSGW